MAGKVGRPATPDKVHWLQGNPSKKNLNQLGGDFSPPAELPKCPPHVKGEARKHYKYIGERLVDYGLVAEIDIGLLSKMAVAWGDYVQARKEIARREAESECPMAGHIARTPKGYEVMSVPLQIANAAEQRYIKLAAEFGLSPSNRSRVTPSSGQMQLPGMANGGADAGQLGDRLADFA